MAISSSSRNWDYDVFLNFRGEDVRGTLRSHLLKELDRKLITVFKDNEAQRSNSLWPELVKAIRNSRIAVVIFSENYASSSWCLNELLEIVNCKDQKVIPVFYHVDPSDVRWQKNDFGKVFETTCERESEEKRSQWTKALTDVANKLGYHSKPRNDEAKMIEDIANDVLNKLLVTPLKDFEGFVGLEDHFAKMSELLQLEYEEVKMVGIWGSSGIGKTTIARALFNQLSRNFQVKKFIDKAFVYKSKEIYCGANPDDHNMKLHLLKNFLSEILKKEDIEIDHLGAVEERLKHQKVLLIIDDLDNLMVLDTLVGQLDWFGSGSRIIVVTKDRQFLRARKIDLIHEVSLPTEHYAIDMLCQYAFKQKSPPDGFEELVVEVVRSVDNLPIAITVLGKDLRERNKEYWIDILPRIQHGLDSKIEKVLRVSYEGLDSEEDKAIFRHIACLFNHVKVNDIKLFLANSKLCVDIGLKHLQDKSLIHVREGHVEMHHLLQEMGRKMVRMQSIDNPGEREFLVDSEDICEVLTEGTGTKKVLGISWHLDEIDECHISESSFKGMSKLRFLKIDDRNLPRWEELSRLKLPENLDYLPPLKLLCWPDYPLRCLASGFSPANLVKLEMEYSELEKLWEGVLTLSGLKSMNLWGSRYLEKIPDLSKATNLEELNFRECVNLVELPSSIRNLNKLLKLNMKFCIRLRTLPTGFNLKSLNELTFEGCSQLTTFPVFSTNISFLDLMFTAIKEFPSNLYLKNLVRFSMGDITYYRNEWERVEVQQLTHEELTPFRPMLSPTLKTIMLTDNPNLVQLPYSVKNLHQLKDLSISNCHNLEILPTGINLQSLDTLEFSGCSRLRSFPDISNNIRELNLDRTGIEEVPWWIEKFSCLMTLSLRKCKNLRCVSFNISKLKNYMGLDFDDCEALTRVDLCGTSFSPPDDYDPWHTLNFTRCFNLDQESLLQHQLFMFKSMILPGEEVPSYFTHQTIGTSSSLTIPLLNIPHSQSSIKVKLCVVLHDSRYKSIKLKLQLKGKFGECYYFKKVFISIFGYSHSFMDRHLFIDNYFFPCYKENAPLDQQDYDHINMKISVYDEFGGFNYRPKFGIRLSEYSEDKYGLYTYYGLHTCYMTENGEDYSDSADCEQTDSETENGEEAYAATQLPIS